MSNPNETKQIRTLVDNLFALQWCRENIVVPLGTERNQATGTEKLTVALGNISYLGTIGDFIKKRASEAGLECQFIEKSPEEIQQLLDNAAQQGLISGGDLEGFEFSDESILDALQDADGEASNGGFDFDFDDSDEQIIEEQALDLSIEMMGTKIQQAAAKILIAACQSGVSDIHVEPRQDNYKVRGSTRWCHAELRNNAPFCWNQTHRLLQKHGENGYCRTACIPGRENPPPF